MLGRAVVSPPNQEVFNLQHQDLWQQWCLLATGYLTSLPCPDASQAALMRKAACWVSRQRGSPTLQQVSCIFRYCSVLFMCCTPLPLMLHFSTWLSGQQEGARQSGGNEVLGDKTMCATWLPLGKPAILRSSRGGHCPHCWTKFKLIV